MPSNRRVKATALAVLLLVVMILYYSSSARNERNQDFYKKTLSAMDSKAAAAREKSDHDDLSIQKKLKAAEQAAKMHADSKTKEMLSGSPDGVAGSAEEKSVAGRKKIPVTSVEEKPLTNEEIAEENAEEELNLILKKGPIIIFSKSYCPYSKAAKTILLDKYSILPAPYVVELDLHDHGPRLQALLAKNTGRKTVPNILINGKSIGGGDETRALHENGELIDKVKTMGGKRITQVELRHEGGGESKVSKDKKDV